MRTFKVLKAVLKDGRTKTVLIDKDNFEGSPSDYFVQPVKAKYIGTIDIDSTDLDCDSDLDCSYTSDD